MWFFLECRQTCFSFRRHGDLGEAVIRSTVGFNTKDLRREKTKTIFIFSEGLRAFVVNVVRRINN